MGIVVVRIAKNPSEKFEEILCTNVIEEIESRNYSDYKDNWMKSDI